MSRRNRESGAVLAGLMAIIVLIGIALMYLSQRTMMEHRAAHTSHTDTAALYAAEAGIESALADIAAGRVPAKQWRDPSADTPRPGVRVIGASAAITVVRTGPDIFITSIGTAVHPGGRVESVKTIDAHAARRGARYVIVDWFEK